MKIFLSWSGEASRQVALALREFLPLVANAFEPWMSEEDIAKGSRWTQELSGRLDDTDAGIVCLTRSNLTAPWLLFEAGALAKTANAAVCPYLFKLRPSDVTGPLALFQSVTSAESKDENRKLMRALYARVKDGNLSDGQLARAFDHWWDSDLSKRLSAIADLPESEAPQRSPDDMLEEILTTVRGLASRPSLFGRVPVHGPIYGTPVDLTSMPFDVVGGPINILSSSGDVVAGTVDPSAGSIASRKLRVRQEPGAYAIVDETGAVVARLPSTLALDDGAAKIEGQKRALKDMPDNAPKKKG